MAEDAKYVQPDAANFNSWRRHIKLVGDPPDEVVFAWEDVKVNGVRIGFKFSVVINRISCSR
jgi:hypothetical protein